MIEKYQQADIIPAIRRFLSNPAYLNAVKESANDLGRRQKAKTSQPSHHYESRLTNKWYNIFGFVHAFRVSEEPD